MCSTKEIQRQRRTSLTHEVTMTEGSRTIRDGMVVGLIGYAAVAIFYSGFDFLAARGSLYTVNLLGRTLFRGLRDTGVLYFPVDLDPTAILLYNALHLALALAIGLVVVRLVDVGDAEPSRRRVVRFMIVAGFVVTIGAVGLLTSSIRPLLPWWSIVAANTLAVLLAGAYLIRRRPGLWRRQALLRSGDFVARDAQQGAAPTAATRTPRS
jgi:hypothetical protein